MSFRLKTILGVALIEAVLLTILVWSGLRYIQTSNEREFAQRALATVTSFAVTTKEAVLSTDLASLDSFVSEVMAFPGVQYARVRDADDRVLASDGDPALLNRDFRMDRELAEAEDGIFDTFAEIAEAGTVFGRVEVGLSVGAVRRVIADAQRYGITIALIEMGLVALFSFFLGVYLTRQLANLTHASERIASGDWGYRVPIQGNDELAAAARAFNLMSSQVKASFSQIADREQNLRSVLENIQDGILVADLEGRVLSQNPSATAIFGFASGSAENTRLAELMLSADWESLAPRICDAESDIWGSLNEVTGRRPGGDRFPMELTLTRINQGEREVLIAVVRDIRERKEAEAQLRLRDRVITTTRAGVVIADASDPELPLIYANPAFENITGYRPEQVLGRNCRFLQGPETEPAAIAEIRAAIGEERDTQVLLRNYRADGSAFWNELIITPIFDERGRLTHYVGLQNDVTERVENQLRLAEHENHLRGVLDATHDAIIVADERGLITSFNLGAEKMFGHRASDVIGANVSILMPVPHSEQHDDYLRRYLQGGVSHVIGQEREFTALHADAHEFPIALRVNEMRKAGRLHFIGVIHDITERKQKETALKRAKEAAEEAAEAKSQFLANMSHEIRTPMHGVLGALEMMRDTPLNRAQSRHLETANSSAEVLLTVIDEILDFSRLEAGKLRIEYLEFDSRKAVEDVIAMLSRSAFEKRLELVSYIDHQVPERLIGDPIRLRQVLINLVGNAVKFTERGEIVVNVTVREKADKDVTLFFEVKDTGIGVPRERQKDLFDAFVQADGSTSRRFGGAGLGLSISRRLVELMGGEIGVRSEQGAGSIFWFQIRFGIQTKRSGDSRDSGFAGRRILIVDDNATNRIIMHRYLSGWGSSPGSAADGHEAIAKMQDSAANGQPYDLAILDYQMPGMTGLELGSRIKTDDMLRNTLLILVSSEPNAEPPDAEAVVDIWLSKPLRQSDLHDAIATLFGRLALPTEEAPRRGKEIDFSGERVLLAEDNAVSQSLAQEMLRLRGLKVQSANNGEEAVKAATRGGFDLILMDVQMPKMDGNEATRRILEWERSTGRPHTPIIALTAHALSQDRERCLNAGMDDYLVKPYNQESLSKIIFRWLSPPGGSRIDSASTEPEPIFAPEKIAEARRIMGDNFPRLLHQFEETLREQLALFRRALEVKATDDLLEAVHRIKNNAGDLGATRLLQRASDLEKQLHHGSFDRQLVDQVLNLGQRVLTETTDILRGEYE